MVQAVELFPFEDLICYGRKSEWMTDINIKGSLVLKTATALTETEERALIHSWFSYSL